jgi:predicted nucleic acid-binding Zn ribbon protein
MPWQALPSESGADPDPIRSSLDRLLRQWGTASTATTQSLFADWDEIVGSPLAAHARPRSLRNGTLVVVVSDPAWATQLRFLEQELLTRIRAATRSDEVTAIQVRVGAA